MNRAAVAALADWLVDGARSAPLAQDVMQTICDSVAAAGIPLWRAALFVRTLHPSIMGRRLLWRQGEAVQASEAPFERMEQAEFRESPVAWIYATGEPLRRRLVDPACPDDFAMLGELRAEGVTDYLVSPLHFTNGEIHVASWTTRAPAGFTEEEIAAMESLVAPIARVTEIRALRRTTVNLLDTYVGRHAGQRILAGRIRPGHTEAIFAVIWLSDMRGFTALADRVTLQTLIDLLNRWFECQVPAIHAHGGEVLKFMGDGLLAVFPVAAADDAAGVEAACRAALASARDARAAIGALGETMREANVDRVRLGLALHVGEVLWGNIGAAGRLDFTCIGPAVNLAARIEGLSGELGRMVLTSAEFARHCTGEVDALGTFALRGFDAPQPLFGLKDERPATG